MSDTTAKAVMWTGVACYTGAVTTYIYQFANGHIAFTLENVVTYGLLLLGFSLLLVIAFTPLNI